MAKIYQFRNRKPTEDGETPKGEASDDKQEQPRPKAGIYDPSAFVRPRTIGIEMGAPGTVENCHIEGFDTGIDIGPGGGGSRIRGTTLRGNFKPPNSNDDK